MKQNQHKTKDDRVKERQFVKGCPVHGIPSYYVDVSHYSPKEAHENKKPTWAKLNK